MRSPVSSTRAVKSLSSSAAGLQPRCTRRSRAKLSPAALSHHSTHSCAARSERAQISARSARTSPICKPCMSCGRWASRASRAGAACTRGTRAKPHAAAETSADDPNRAGCARWVGPDRPPTRSGRRDTAAYGARRIRRRGRRTSELGSAPCMCATTGGTQALAAASCCARMLGSACRAGPTPQHSSSADR